MLPGVEVEKRDRQLLEDGGQSQHPVEAAQQEDEVIATHCESCV